MAGIQLRSVHEVMSSEGTVRQFTVRDTKIEWVAKSMNCTMLEKVWFILSNAGSDK